MAETKKQKKIAKVMGEFKDKKLKGRDKKTITNPKLDRDWETSARN